MTQDDPNYEIEPTIEQLSDPYVLQLIRGISDLMDVNEDQEAEVSRLKGLLLRSLSDNDRLEAAVQAAHWAFLNDGDSEGARLMKKALTDDD